MLQLQNVTLTEIKTNRNLVENVSFTLQEKDKLAIIGEEGNGKSTLLKAIVNTSLVPYVRVRGNIVKQNVRIGYVRQFLEKEWADLPVRAYFLKQNPTSEDDYAVYEKYHTLCSIMQTLGLSASLLETEQPIKTLSGGEKVKLQLAKVLLSNPTCLLLDEPTNDVDIATLTWLENFIQTYDNPIMYVSHDETLLEKTANCILHIELTQKKTKAICTYERIGYADYIQKRMLSLEKQEQIARKERAQDQERMERWQQIYNKVHSQQNSISRQDPHGARLLKKKMQSVLSQQKHFEKQRENFTDIPELEEAIKLAFAPCSIPAAKSILSLQVPVLRVNDKVLARNIQLEIYGPQKVVITGKNGVGKTTLLRQILEMIKQQTSLHVGYMPQNYEEELCAYTTVLEFLESFCVNKEQLTKARTYLGGLKFTQEEMCGKIEYLSGGQRAKLYLLKLMLKQVEVLILDEPTRNLSPLSNPVLRKMLASFSGAIIAVSHDRKFMQEVATQVYVMDNYGLHKSQDI